MAQYIDKAALVKWAEETYLCENASMVRKVCFKQLLEYLDIIDTLETERVNLEKEIDDAFLENKCNITDNVSLAEFVRIAKHFYELGLQARKGEQ